jgi:uncharacterized protein (DUF924 family)
VEAGKGVTADELIAIIDQAAPLDWLGLIILLDQIPRNCYRGERAWIPFKVFDPLAQEVAKRANQAGIPSDGEMQKYVAYRSWFVFPLMHAEDKELQRKGVEMCHEMWETARSMVGVARQNGVREHDLELAVNFAEKLEGYAKRHQAVVERFGRFPHRNKVLGRVSTPEEEAYLRDGGETFGG